MHQIIEKNVEMKAGDLVRFSRSSGLKLPSYLEGQVGVVLECDCVERIVRVFFVDQKEMQVSFDWIEKV